MPIVVDTNVFAIAEGMHDGASQACVDACTNLLLRIRAGHVIAADSGDQILVEYVATLTAARRSGLATKLANYLYRTRHGGQTCALFEITVTGVPQPVYQEVPPALHDFDQDDQKFIAVAAVAGAASPLVAGLDGEWWDRRDDFATSGIGVQFPCLADLI